jgi:hypothetical protein
LGGFHVLRRSLKAAAAARRSNRRAKRDRIEAAFATSRDGGDAHSAAMFEAQLPKARAVAQKLAKR